MARETEHGIVHAEPGVYAGWPANHGAWQWGDEFLVGYIVGKYGRGPMHNVVGPLNKVQSRSLDGGRTWKQEIPNCDFNAVWSWPPPEFDLRNSIIRVCGGYDHGGEDCHPRGGFYLSEDRGKHWRGAYAFTGLEDEFSEPLRNTSRTAVLGGLLFLSANYSDSFGTDHVVVARHDGSRFSRLSIIADAAGRIVMPAPVRIGSLLILAARRRDGFRSNCWIDAYSSADEGVHWQFLARVGDTGGHNGNPPALIESSGRLICAFANRSDKAMFVSVSDDLGTTWSERQPLREGGKSDIGYPRLLKRGDGRLICIYYWADEDRPHQHIAWTAFDP